MQTTESVQVAADTAIPRWLLPLALLLLAAVVGWLIYTRVIQPAGMMGWDQAGHALRGLVLAQEIEDRDGVGLLYDIYRQVYWPPVHTVALAGAFATFGHSIAVARTVSLVLFLFGTAVLYGCGLRMQRSRGAFIGFVAAVLYLTAPALTPYAGQVMLEIPALIAMYFTVWIFFGLDESRAPWHYSGLGLAIVLTYLTKLNYGVLLLLVVGLELLIEARFRPLALFNRRMLYLTLAIVIPLALWFAYPPKLWRTWEALINQPFGTVDAFSVEGLLYYPRALIELSGSPLLFVLFMLALAYAVWRTPRDRQLRILVLIVALQFLIGQLHQTKVDRHLFPLLPALYLATGSLLVNLPAPAQWSAGRRRLVSAGLTLMLLIYSGWLFGSNLRPASTIPRHAAADEVAALVDEGESTLILSTINLVRPAPPQLDWILAAEYDLLPATLSDVAMNLEQDRSVAALARGLPGPAFVGDALANAAERSRAPGQARTLYLGLSDYTGYSQSPDSLRQFLRGMRDEALFERVLVVVPIDPARGFVPIGQPPYEHNFLTEPLTQLGFVEETVVRFEDDNVQIMSYGQ
jgi:hypothetical protein